MIFTSERIALFRIVHQAELCVQMLTTGLVKYTFLITLNGQSFLKCILLCILDMYLYTIRLYAVC